MPSNKQYPKGHKISIKQYKNKISCLAQVNQYLNKVNMHRKLEIKLMSEQKQQNHSKVQSKSNEEISYSQSFQEQSHEIIPHQSQSRSNQVLQSSPQGAYESVQTFGNHIHSNNKFLNQLMNITKKHNSNHKSNLSQTPISSKNLPNSYTRRQYMQQSQLDEQIDRIINKVSNKTPNEQTHIQMRQIEKVKKIDRINKQLLKQNTSLINQINILQRKLNELNQKTLFTKQKGKKTDDSSMVKTLKSYKQKYQKAMNLNKKLSVRLTSEKSKSQIISNTFRSMINRQQGNSSEMVSNTLRSQINDQTSQNHKLVYCRKCQQMCTVSNQQNSKNIIFSPVLQVKNYEISRESKTKQFELVRKARDFECQTNLQSNHQRQELLQLSKQQQLLQKTIQENNKKILEYQKILYKLVQIS